MTSAVATTLTAEYPVYEERVAALEAMTPIERLDRFTTNRFSLSDCELWARRYPDEVPRIGTEFAFYALRDPAVVG